MLDDERFDHSAVRAIEEKYGLRCTGREYDSGRGSLDEPEPPLPVRDWSVPHPYGQLFDHVIRFKPRGQGLLSRYSSSRLRT